MTIITYEITVTHQYLMNRRKEVLRQWLEEQHRELCVRMDVSDFTKEDFAYRIMRNIPILERLNRAREMHAARLLQAEAAAAGFHE